MVFDRFVLAQLCRARALLDEGDLEIADVARAAGMSPFHFIRRFDELFGTTPHQHRIAARLDRAKQLLARGAPVTDVCLEVGWSSLGTFSALFKRRVGQSPSTYRRRARTLGAGPGALPAQLFPGCLSLLALLPAHAFRSFQEA
jgi:AraC-like DNA-binding protein